MVYAMLMGETYLYQITIEGELDGRWPEWFEGVDITKQAGLAGYRSRCIVVSWLTSPP